MKNPNRETASELEALPNIGKAIGADLRSIGVETPQELIGRDPFELYEKLCVKKGERIDPCVIDVFMSVVDFMEGSEPQAWWAFTSKRKEILKSKKES